MIHRKNILATVLTSLMLASSLVPAFAQDAPAATAPAAASASSSR